MKEKYMEMAIDLAYKGQGYTSPNPMVGAVIVKDDQVISTGYHQGYGKPHGERDAINKCPIDKTHLLAGSDMYVTLEPCCHIGKTLPCTDIIIEKKIKRVIIGSQDPNPLVSGKGVETLRKAGIEVVESFMKEKCDEINPPFFHFIKNKTPYITVKWAMTLDGKIATRTGDSKWITSPSSRQLVHYYRHISTAIMVGVGTVLADDPTLDCRLESFEGNLEGVSKDKPFINPIRVICDTNLKTPLKSNIVETSHLIDTYIVTLVDEIEAHKPYKDKGCNIIVMDKVDQKEQIYLPKLMEVLGQLNIDSLYVEGGGTLNHSFFQSGLVNRVQTYIGPVVIGGSQAKSPVEGIGVSNINQGYKFKLIKSKSLGDDLFIEWEANRCLQD